MAPTKGGKPSSVKGKGKPTGKPAGKSAGGSAGRVTKPSSSSKPKGPIKATQQKTKSTSHKPEKKKRRVYTDKELNIPKLNGITPAGVVKAKGMKKGKTFVDDQDGMMAILAMVQADKEGDIESKIMRSRHMEEIREARRVEAEKREVEKKKRFEEVKDDIRKSKGDKRKQKVQDAMKAALKLQDEQAEKKSKKRVSFG